MEISLRLMEISHVRDHIVSNEGDSSRSGDNCSYLGYNLKVELTRLTTELDKLYERRVKGEDKVFVIAIGRLELPGSTIGKIGKETGLK